MLTARQMFFTVEVSVLEDQMPNHWRDPAFRYHTAGSHDNATAFRRRMQERQRAVGVVVVAATSKVQPIKKAAVK